tara:strand:- start:820 stop:1494 length:675 start_codon:yes stop_codon:yes gene_type:complete
MFTPFFSYGQAAILALILGDKVSTEKFNLSLEIGGNFTHYSHLENFDRTRLGINFGIAGNIKVSPRFYISPNVIFLGDRKIKFNSLSPDTTNEILNNQFSNVPTDLNLSYIDIPILFSYLNKRENFKYSFGPQYSFLQKADMVYFGDDGEFTQGFSSKMSSNDYGFITDIAYIFKNFKGEKDMHIHLRYYYGMKDIFRSSFDSSMNRSSYVSVMLSFPFIKKEK